MKNVICVYDFETDSPDPLTCNPVQLAACIISNMSLEIIPDSNFCIEMRPLDMDDPTYVDRHRSTIDWHAKNYGVEPDEIIKKWGGSVQQSEAWKQFTTYLGKYNAKQSHKGRWDAPIRAGANIVKFDNLIIDRLAKAYGNVTKDGEQTIFYPRDIIDTKDIAFCWFESLPEPQSYSVDALRKYFDMPPGGHDAIKDVTDTAWMVQKFFRLFRKIAPKVDFAGAYSRKEEVV